MNPPNENPLPPAPSGMARVTDALRSVPRLVWALFAVVVVMMSCASCCTGTLFARTGNSSAATSPTVASTHVTTRTSTQHLVTSTPTKAATPKPTLPPFNVTYSGSNDKTTAPLAVPNGTWYLSWRCKPNGNDYGLGASFMVTIYSKEDGSYIDSASITCPPGGLNNRLEEQGGGSVYFDVVVVGVDWVLIAHQ